MSPCTPTVTLLAVEHQVPRSILVTCTWETSGLCITCYGPHCRYHHEVHRACQLQSPRAGPKVHISKG